MIKNTSGSNKLEMNKDLPIIITVIGTLLMVFMIVVEDEPGAIPLLFILTGTGWYHFSRSRVRKRQM